MANSYELLQEQVSEDQEAISCKTRENSKQETLE